MLTIELVEHSMQRLNGLFREHANCAISLQQLGHFKDGDVHLGCDRLEGECTRKPNEQARIMNMTCSCLYVQAHKTGYIHITDGMTREN